MPFIIIPSNTGERQPIHISQLAKIIELELKKIATAKNKNLLSPSQLEKYEAAKKEQNIVYLKGKKLFEFDSETAKRIKSVGLLKAGGARM